MTITPNPNIKENPTTEELIKHLQDGGHIIYASNIFINDLAASKLISTDSRAEFIYSIRDNKTLVVKRMKFGNLHNINFKVEFVQLVINSSI